jgi:hypothetical protein
LKIFLPILLILSISLAKDVPFKTGESLKYSAEFNLIPVGQAELYVSGIEQIQGNDAYHVSFSAQTKGLANQLFKIRDQIDIWLDSKELYTHRLKKNIREGSYRKSVDITFDYDEGVARTNTKDFKINFTARDPFSMFYYLRTIQLKEKEIMSFTSFEGKNIVNYDLQITGKEIINSPVGTFVCKVIRPFRKGKNLFKNQGDMQIWISEDARRLPVKIQIKMKFGSMTLLLKKIN